MRVMRDLLFGLFVLLGGTIGHLMAANSQAGRSAGSPGAEPSALLLIRLTGPAVGAVVGGALGAAFIVALFKLGKHK